MFLNLKRSNKSCAEVLRRVLRRRPTLSLPDPPLACSVSVSASCGENLQRKPLHPAPRSNTSLHPTLFIHQRSLLPILNPSSILHFFIHLDHAIPFHTISLPHLPEEAMQALRRRLLCRHQMPIPTSQPPKMSTN